VERSNCTKICAGILTDGASAEQSHGKVLASIEYCAVAGHVIIPYQSCIVGAVTRSNLDATRFSVLAANPGRSQRQEFPHIPTVWIYQRFAVDGLGICKVRPATLSVNGTANVVYSQKRVSPTRLGLGLNSNLPSLVIEIVLLFCCVCVGQHIF
jgi:hypothetical protein